MSQNSSFGKPLSIISIDRIWSARSRRSCSVPASSVNFCARSLSFAAGTVHRSATSETIRSKPILISKFSGYVILSVVGESVRAIGTALHGGAPTCSSVRQLSIRSRLPQFSACYLVAKKLFFSSRGRILHGTLFGFILASENREVHITFGMCLQILEQ